VGCREGARAVVKLLLEKGAEPEAKDVDGRTPLSWAAQHGHGAVMKLLTSIVAPLTESYRDRAPA
jgi:ankyrin repeat protein